jgi:hypothetical protein
MEEENKSKISNVEWGLVFGGAVMIDIMQALLEWVTMGFSSIINPFIDGFVGMSFALYLQIRGEKLNDPKRAFGLLSTFLLEMIPGLDEAPLWSIYVIYAMLLSKRKVIAKNLTPTVAGNDPKINV